ncbi:hypothetical protein A4A49_64020 [Nicotiana attenuata]|uniref:Uncharacterized protein n=1 Tax=Nicotiana attenuata TaxID=49451 RepID=A0A314LFD2_NICAT|nr:hypothetical protein A4A49_64020 [Nicotiana attenuata]
MADDEIVDGEEGQEVSSQKVGESFETQQDVVCSGEVSIVPTPSFDLNIATPTCNIPPAYSDTLLGVNEREAIEAIENMLLISTEG